MAISRFTREKSLEPQKFSSRLTFLPIYSSSPPNRLLVLSILNARSHKMCSVSPKVFPSDLQRETEFKVLQRGWTGLSIPALKNRLTDNHFKITARGYFKSRFTRKGMAISHFKGTELTCNSRFTKIPCN